MRRPLAILGIALSTILAVTEAAAASRVDERELLGESFEGRPIRVFHRGDPEEIRVLVVGCIHGDECAGIQITRRLRTGEPRHFVDLWILPNLNPDGRAAHTRQNARGVDLNRNFPTPNWERDAPLYWDKRTRKDPRRWPGHKPLSEPESRFLHEQMQRFQPHLIVAIHAPYGVLDFDGPSVPPSKLGRLYLDQVGIFPGSLGHYGGVHKGVPVVTIELPNAMRTPLDSEMRQMWVDLLRWIGERGLGTERGK